MQALDRVTQPPFQQVGRFHIKQVQRTTLDNGRALFYLERGDQSVFKVEILIRAGSLYTSQYELVPLTLKMLNESTKRRSGNEVSNTIDSLGAFIELSPGFDFSSISVYSLTKHFNKITELLFEIIREPKFDEKEFSNLKKKESQKLRLNQEKNAHQCSVALRKSLFGENHPYGKSQQLDVLEKVDLTSIKSLFESNYDDFDILISGSLPANFHNVLNEFFGKEPIKKVTPKLTNALSEPKDIFIEKRKSIQSSVKIGKLMFSRSHPDYIKLLVTNELLGGFFGSRLMKNIREDKGLTYGIYSHLYALAEGGYFCISSDVKGNLTNQAVDEILKEVEHLHSVKIPQAELDTVKNYMLGTFSASVATPFSLMDRFKAVHYQGLNYDYYEEYFDTLEHINTHDLQIQSQKHLSIDSLTTCVVGPNN